MSNAPAVPDYSPTAKRERAKKHQLEAIAQFSVLGIPAASIAGITELSETYINRILQGGQSKEQPDAKSARVSRSRQAASGYASKARAIRSRSGCRS